MQNQSSIDVLIIRKYDANLQMNTYANVRFIFRKIPLEGYFWVSHVYRNRCERSNP